MFLMVNSHRKKNISNQSKEVQEEIPQCFPFQNKMQKGSILFQKYKSPQQTNPNSKKQILPKQPEIPWFSWFIYPWHRWFLLNHKPPANSFQIPMDASFKIHGAISFFIRQKRNPTGGFWNTHKILTSWWLNQPIWKICSSKWIMKPQVGVKIKNTPPKFNMEPENHPLEKEKYLPNLHFWVPC